MIFIEFKLEGVNKGRVTLIDYVPEEVLNPQSGVFTSADIPELPPSEIGYSYCLFYKPEDDEFYYEKESRPLTQEEEIIMLRQENAILLNAVTELTMYSATQDERIAIQEQAITELSMLMAGGNE